MRRRGLNSNPALRLFLCCFFSVVLPLQAMAQEIPRTSAIDRDAGKQGASNDGTAAFAQKARAREAAAASAPQMSQPQLEASLNQGLATYRATQALDLDGRSDLAYLATPEAAQDLAAMVQRNPSDFVARWRPRAGTPRLLAGTDLMPGTRAASGDQTVDVAHEFLHQNRALLKLEDPREEMELIARVDDGTGLRAVRFAQTINDLPVWGSDVVVRFDRQGRVTGFSGHYAPAPESSLGKSAAIAAQSAERTALQFMRDRDSAGSKVDEAQLMYFPQDERLRLSWMAVVREGLHYAQEVFVNAVTGEYLHSVSLVATDGPVAASGSDLSGTNRSFDAYEVGTDIFAIDTTKSMFDASGALPQEGKGVIQILNANNGNGEQLFFASSPNANNWTGLENAVSCAFNGSIVFDYFEQRHGRNSLDNVGMNMNMIVNYESNFNNAFWTGQFMVFGNGDGNQFSDLAGSLDVTGHEMSHGVVQNTAGLVYQFQSGALNEHFADAFGAGVEFFERGAGGNWLMGEDITSPNVAGDALRDMENPDGPLVAFNGQQPAHMDQFQNLPIETDNGGVHINSGIPNRAFFLASDPASSIGGIGIDKTEDIWYRALTQYLNRNSNFNDFATAVSQSAADLFGANSLEQQRVQAALASVGLAEGNDENPGDWDGELCDGGGTGFLAVIDPANGQIVRSDTGATEFVTLSPNSIHDFAGRPSVTDDGSVLCWVGDDFNIWIGNTNGTGATPLTSDGAWWSVAINADGSLIAATPRQSEPIIVVFDTSSGQGTGFPIFTESSSDGGATNNDMAYADVLEFAVVGDRLVYDALHSFELNGTTNEYWDINILRLVDGVNVRVFQPLPSNESIGNPTLAKNNDLIIAFDHLAGDGNIYVEAVNIQTGATGVITNNFGSLGRPSYTGDDSQVVYQFETNNPPQVWVVGTTADRLSGLGDDFAFLNGALAPVFFSIGQRCPVPVALSDFEGAWRSDHVALQWRVNGLDDVAGFHVERRVDGNDWDRRTVSPMATDAATADGLFQYDDRTPTGATAVAYRVMAQQSDGRLLDLGSVELGKDAGELIASRVELMRNYPNPFNPRTTLRFAIGETEAQVPVSLAIYDIRGREVARLLDAEVVGAGVHEVSWSGTDHTGDTVAAGNYFVRLEAAGKVRTNSITLIK